MKLFKINHFKMKKRSSSRIGLVTALLLAANQVSIVASQDNIDSIEASKDPKEAIDCFTESPMFGDQDENHVTTSDLDMITQLKADHVLNAVRVCPDLANRNVLGIQVSYTRYADDGRITDEVFLTGHGMVVDSPLVTCQTIDLEKG